MAKNCFRKTFFCFLFLFVLLNPYVKSQYIYNFSSHNFLQFNPAYAGQDTNHCFFLGAELDPDLLNHISERPRHHPYTFQLSYAGNFKKFRSGLAAIGSISGIGVEKAYDITVSYNYNFIINDSSNLRVGLNWHERIMHIDPRLFIFNDPGGNDLSLIKKSSFNFDLGLWYVYKKFNLGFSVQNIFEKKNIQIGSSLYEQGFNAIAGYEFVIAGPVKTKPAVIFHNFGGSYSTYLLSNSFVFDDTFILGIGYTFGESQYRNGPFYLEVGAHAGKHVLLMLGYSNSFYINSFSERISAMVKVNLY